MKLSLRTLLLAPAWLCLAWLPLAGQAASVAGSGKTSTETRPVAEFQAIALNGSMDLVVRQGAQQTVTVQADDNLLPLLETVVETTRHGATLNVRWKQGHRLHSSSKVLLTVVVPRLSALVAAGSGDTRVESFTTPALKLALSGAGDVQLIGLATEDLGISIAGSGDVGGNGKATRVKINIAGSGDVSLAEMLAEDVRVSIGGSGDAAVNAQKSLDVSIAGSGDVSYAGPAAVKSSVVGSGSVTKR